MTALDCRALFGPSERWRNAGCGTDVEDEVRHRGHGAVSAWVRLLLVAVSLVACSPSTSDRPSARSTSAASAGATEPTERGTTATTGVTTASPSTRQYRNVVVLEEDAGKKVRLRPGQQLRVELGADFRPVSVSDEDVLRPLTLTGGYPTSEPLIAVLAAVSPGDIFLSSSTDFACLYETMPCSMPQREWRLSVTVTAD
jgi:hypothetical protein